MNFESVRSIIDTYIKKNGVEAITGDILNNVLNTMLDDVDTAISSIEPSPGGGSGEGGVSEEDVLNILEKNNYITSSALSNYYTKAQSDARYLALSGGTILGSMGIVDYLYISNNRGIYAYGNNGVAYPMAMITSDNTLLYGDGYLTMGIGGYNIYLQYGYNRTNGVVLNESGNVTIGGSDLAGTYAYAKLCIDGVLAMPKDDTRVLCSVLGFSEGNLYLGYSNVSTYNTIILGKNIQLSPSGGNVLIGTTTDSGARLTISNPSSREVLCINSNASNGPIVYLAASNQLTAGFGYDGVAKVMWFENFSASSGLYLNNVGNVGIGTTSPAYKLDVTGDSRINGALRVQRFYDTNSYLDIVASDVSVSYNAYDNSDGWCLQYFRCQDKTIMTLAADGANINGNLIVSGDFSFGSDIRFKDKIEDIGISIADIAKAPLFTYKWNDREDDTIYLGSSAQYWEKIAPWLVSGDDFKSLNYATLGVAMGISLAKKTINHEERIKILEAEIKRLKREQYGN